MVMPPGKERTEALDQIDKEMQSIESIYSRKINVSNRKFLKYLVVSGALTVGIGPMCLSSVRDYLNPYTDAAPLEEVNRLEDSLRSVNIAKSDLESYVYELPYESKILKETLDIAKSADEIKSKTVANMSSYLSTKLKEVKSVEAYKDYAAVNSGLHWTGLIGLLLGFISLGTLGVVSSKEESNLRDEWWKKTRKLQRKAVNMISPG